MPDASSTRWLNRALVAGLLGILLGVGFIVMQPFLVAIVWSAIVVFVSWPLHLRLVRLLGGHRSWAALAMTALLTLVSGMLLAWLGFLLRTELVASVRDVTALLKAGVTVPEPIARIPWLGPWLQEHLAEIARDPAALGRELSDLADQWGGRALRAAGDLGVNTLLFGVALVTAYFLFRDGDRLLLQLRKVLRELLGERIDGYFEAVGSTTRAVVYGLLLAALAQGLMAGLGYWVAGVKAPVFWGVATAAIAMIPFGAPLVWGSISIWLLLLGKVAAGAGLLLWGLLVVSWIDNLIRPMVISGVANIPFLIVLFGVLGGLAAFGLIGLFVGPVVLAVLLALWREWAEGHEPGGGGPP